MGGVGIGCKKHLQVRIFDQFTYTSLTNLSYIKHEVLETICWQLFQGSELIIVKIIIQELAEGDIMMLKKRAYINQQMSIVYCSH